MAEEKEEYGYHKLEVGQKIRVFKNTYNDVNYYRMCTTQKNYDGSQTKFYIPLQFKKNVELENETDIIVKQFVDNCRANPKDTYNCVRFYQINKFEIVERQEQVEKKAYDDFRENLSNNENDPFAEVEIDDNFLD